MLTQEQHEQLVQVDAGTPMGELLRRYWHPIGAVADLEAEPVQPIRILGEDLTLFRIPQGGGAWGQETDARPSQPPTPDPQPPTPNPNPVVRAHRGAVRPPGPLDGVWHPAAQRPPLRLPRLDL